MVGTLTRTVFTQAFVLLLFKPLVISSVKQAGCLVTRVKNGDRIQYNESYNRACSARDNPCQSIEGSLWKNSKRINCVCQCSKAAPTYREDIGHCVENKINREGCSLLFNRESVEDPLKVFSNSSSARLKEHHSLKVEGCRAIRTYYCTDQRIQPWKQLQTAGRQTFSISRKNRQAQFLEWNNGQPEAALFGKIVKVQIECEEKEEERSNSNSEPLCIVFKVHGFSETSCPVGEPAWRLPTTHTFSVTDAVNSSSTISYTATLSSEEATQKPTLSTATDGSGRSLIEDIENDSNTGLSVGKKVAIPIWLIGVIAGGAVIGTLAISAIIWMCCRMKQRQRKRRKRRARLAGNPIHNQDDAFVTFSTPESSSRTCEAGYAKVVSPDRKGYAVLKPTLGRTRSDYQQLLRPCEDHSGYLLPMEERSKLETTEIQETSTTEPAMYSQAENPFVLHEKPKDKEDPYAKLCELTTAQARPDNLNFRGETDSRYVEYGENQKDIANDGSSSPVYATLEGPDSPPLKGPTGLSHEEAPTNHGPEGTNPEYLEIIPSEESHPAGSVTNTSSEA
ncbi:PREDICTED: uncharacterized protein LOC107341430 isoform X2 [Acropora digitifera]|uniref:uncharacterized protein LOC107341430 isoform X2 n=1 Tax=Acropora digitifera TaxID=70779 RepID=UPI00077A9925|nr:PREDICTED: uncharacterized protein LOC107341430 isoform X2 [Acropora digitifera]